MFSSAQIIRDLTNKKSPTKYKDGERSESSRSPAPAPSVSRHRRSYTISAPYDFRVETQHSPHSPHTVPSSPEPPSRSKGKERATDTRFTSTPQSPIDDSETPPPFRKARPRIFHTTSIFHDRFIDLPPLPASWNSQHDRAMCVLDSRNYSPAAIVNKLRRVFPELNRGTLMPAMVEKRLRILDQNIEVDYWRLGMESLERSGLAKRDGGKGRERQDEVNREPRLKATKSGSLLKSPSMATMSNGTPSRGPKKEFGSGLKTIFNRM